MSEKAAADIPDNAQDLTIFVQNLLEQMVSILFQLIDCQICNYRLLLFLLFLF